MKARLHAAKPLRRISPLPPLLPGDRQRTLFLQMGLRKTGASAFKGIPHPHLLPLDKLQQWAVPRGPWCSRRRRHCRH